MDRINRAKGDSERFLAALVEYKKAPEITKKKIIPGNHGGYPAAREGKIYY